MSPSRRVNLIVGPNGSGKTSLLEAIHLLGVGRSFRSVKVAPLIQYGATSCTIFGELDGGAVSIGLQKSRHQKPILKLQGERQSNWVEAAHRLPIQVLDSTAFLLLEGSSKVRRRFLDWGVFHVEPQFVDHWRNSRRCIAHRNHLLKAGRLDVAQLAPWEAELDRAGAQVDAARSRYFQAFMSAFDEVLNALLPLEGLSVSYQRGWDTERSLAEVLASGRESDRRYGATQFGPHRADLLLRIGRHPAVEVLSRGQQKLVVSAMKIAQAVLLSQTEATSSRHCVFLIDDLPAELDAHNRQRVCEWLENTGSQVFLTCVDDQTLIPLWRRDTPLTAFHVEHGKIAPSYHAGPTALAAEISND